MTKIRANSNNTKSRKNFNNNRNSINSNRRIIPTTVATKPNRRINNNSVNTSGKMIHQSSTQHHQSTATNTVVNSSNFKAATNSNLVNINNLNYGTSANSHNMYRVNNNTSKKINNKPNKQSGRNSFSSGGVTQTPPFAQFNVSNQPVNSRYRGQPPVTRNMTTRRQSQPQQMNTQQQHMMNPLMFQPIQQTAPTVLNDVTVNLTRDEPRLVIFNASLNNQANNNNKPNKNMFHFNNKFNSCKYPRSRYSYKRPGYMIPNFSYLDHPFQFHPKSNQQQHSQQQPQQPPMTAFNPFNRPANQVRTRSYYKNLRTQLQLHQSGNSNSKFQHTSLVPPQGASGKFKAPYNTTQYIMFDYSRRMPALKDLQCPSEQQQFDNDWDMAMLQEALTPSATFKPIIMPGATIIEDSDDEVELIYMDPNHAPIKKSSSESQLLLLDSTGQSGDNNRLLADTPMTTDDEAQKQLLSTSI